MLDDDGHREASAPDHDPADARQWLADSRESLIFLTRLPLRRETGLPSPALAGAMRAFPVAGLVVGLISGAVLVLAYRLGAPAPVAALLAVGTGVLVTGALHEDGLGDVADGFGGGESREQKLEIMRDSRIGSYGVLALIFAVALKVTAIASLAAAGSWLAFAVIIAAAAVSRAAPVGLLHLLPAARLDGLSVAAGRPGRSTALQALGLAVAVSLMVLWPHSVLLAVVLLPAAGLAGLAVMAWLAQRQIGGQTGDVAGATQVMSEVLILIVAASVVAR